jgi:hypothetical protein
MHPYMHAVQNNVWAHSKYLSLVMGNDNYGKSILKNNDGPYPSHGSLPVVNHNVHGMHQCSMHTANLKKFVMSGFDISGKPKLCGEEPAKKCSVVRGW